MERQIEQAASERFIELYGHLLAYVNTAYGEVAGIGTYEDLSDREDAKLRSIRNRLYAEDTDQLIGDFVAENPAGLDDDDLQTVGQ